MEPKRQFVAAGLAIVLAASALSPETVHAQDGFELRPGPWEGVVVVSGSFERLGTHSTGTPANSLITVGSNFISMEFVVDESSEITSGTMDVNLAWTDRARGIIPLTTEPYDILNDNTLVGTLQLSGTPVRIIAEGSIVWTANVYDTRGNLVEGVSGPKNADVRWVFEATESGICGVSEGRVTSGGKGIMVTATIDDPANSVRAVSRIWPANEDLDVLGMADELATIEEAIDDNAVTPGVEKQEFKALIDAVLDMRERLRALDECALAEIGLNQGWQHWVRWTLNNIIARAMLQPELWNHTDLFGFVHDAAQAGVFGEGNDQAQDLFNALGFALDTKLNEAIAAENFMAIADIMIFAGQYGYDDLNAKANDALEPEEGGS